MTVVNRVFDRTIRPLLPPKRVEMGGVDAFAGTVLDVSLGDVPDYEAEMRRAIHEHVREGDRVRAVGGGYGVTAVVACEAGAENVEVAEAAREAVDCCRRTARYHGLNSSIRVHHAWIGAPIDVWGAQVGQRRSVEWVRNCDVLELDCEGAEQMILGSLDTDGPLPRVMLVESHGDLGSPTSYVRERLRVLNYEIVSEEFEVEAEDVCVIAAVRRDP